MQTRMSSSATVRSQVHLRPIAVWRYDYDFAPWKRGRTYTRADLVEIPVHQRAFAEDLSSLHTRTSPRQVVIAHWDRSRGGYQRAYRR